MRQQKAKYASPRGRAGWLARRQSIRSIRPPGNKRRQGCAIRSRRPLKRAPTSIPPASSTPAACSASACARIETRDGSNSFLALPGDDVEITYPSAGKPPKPLSAKFTVVDFYESKMNEYDSSFVFVPIRKLQELRGMVDPATGVGNFNSIQIRLKPGADLDKVRDLLRAPLSDRRFYVVSSWRDKQGALLAAVQMETAVLNVLLFMIIAVAGFGILAIFLHDRVREDARHRHPEIARRQRPGHHGHLPCLRHCASASSVPALDW